MTHKRHTKKKTTATKAEPTPKRAKAKPEQPDNMRIWNGVCETDPDFTKEVGFRGGFTSIDPQYQLQRMTETFGPCGQGWGYEAEGSEIRLDETDIIHKVEVRVWWRDSGGDVRYLGPVTAAAMLIADGRVDLDAPKKALTDGLTKSFSRLGLNADVFLGKFDDPAYVQELRKKKDGPATEDQVKQVVAIGKLKGEDWVEQITKHFEIDTLEDISRTQAELVLDRMKEQSNS